MYSSSRRQVRSRRHAFREVVEDNQRRTWEAIQTAPDLLHLTRLLRFCVYLNARGRADLRDECTQAAIGVDPVHAARVSGPEPVGILDRELCLPKAARADNHAGALEDCCAVAKERIMQLPERIHPSDELVAERMVGHTMPFRQRIDRRQFRPVGKGLIVAGYAAETTADPGIVRFKQHIGGDIESLHLTEEARKRGEVPARSQHQWSYFAP